MTIESSGRESELYWHLENIPPAKPSTLPEHGYDYLPIKRGLDIVLASVALVAILPVLGLLAVLIARDGGKVFYGQKRLGQNGRVFMMWKLRSMVPDAENRLAQYLANDATARQEWERTQKLRCDPRVTPIGRILRKYSLDELPQFWNVLMGELSLVGPRPMFEAQQELYPGKPYFGVCPGLTCLWQISDRNACSFAERAAYDARYASSMCLRADLSILMRTVGVVFRGTGC